MGNERMLFFAMWLKAAGWTSLVFLLCWLLLTVAEGRPLLHETLRIAMTLAGGLAICFFFAFVIAEGTVGKRLRRSLEELQNPSDLDS